MNERKVWFIRVTNEWGQTGVGEVAPIVRLSPEDIEEIPSRLAELKNLLEKVETPVSEENALSLAQQLVPIEFPSIRFGLEVALLDLLNGGTMKVFRKDLASVSIPINGLVWMGPLDFIKRQIKEKLDEGFACIKLKVGALDFETELSIVKELREVSDDLIIRLDANGAFLTNEVLSKLKLLSRYRIHSVEQPILPMQPEAMQIVCAKSEIPIAFDEELIYVFSSQDKLELIQDLKPHYLVLKPTLHGGFSSVKEWIDLAEMHSIEWWITSYLESNVGLNAIAQFASLFPNEEFHGLGTGNLYTNNIVSPIQIENGRLNYAESNTWGNLYF